MMLCVQSTEWVTCIVSWVVLVFFFLVAVADGTAVGWSGLLTVHASVGVAHSRSIPLSLMSVVSRCCLRQCDARSVVRARVLELRQLSHRLVGWGCSVRCAGNTPAVHVPPACAPITAGYVVWRGDVCACSSVADACGGSASCVERS